MSLNSQYNFKEKQLDPNFAKDKLTEFKGLIELGQSFTVLSMPGVGVSYFLKYLASQDFAFFIHVDLYNLPTLNQHEFYRMFLRDLGGNPDSKSDEQVFVESKQILKSLASKNKKLVIIFSRFDQLKNDFDINFLSNLQSLATIDEGKIVLIFTSVLPLYELAPEAIKGGNLSFYSRSLYFKPFKEEELLKMFTLEHTIKFHPESKDMAKLSGGHNQLFHVFMNSHKKNNLLLDKFVTLQIKDLISYLDYQQRKQVQKVALGKKVDEIDEYLLGVGYILETKQGPRLFSPLIEEYIRLHLPAKLPVKEAKLFKLLIQKIDKVVVKDEIFAEVWGENDEGATDWALDALIYRLRKHPFIKSNGYIIESHKKVGYTLIQG